MFAQSGTDCFGNSVFQSQTHTHTRTYDRLTGQTSTKLLWVRPELVTFKIHSSSLCIKDATIQMFYDDEEGDDDKDDGRSKIFYRLNGFPVASPYQ